MKSIMYHYIQKRDKNLKYLNYLNFQNFEKQIKYFKNKYLFFDCNFFENFTDKNNFNKKIFLTFDDSLKCHYKYVFKILKLFSTQNTTFYTFEKCPKKVQSTENKLDQRKK